jgi:hypothetical protein
MMSYSDEKKQAALDCLAANEGDFKVTAKDTGIGVRTLQRWAGEASEDTPEDALHKLRDNFVSLKERIEAGRNENVSDNDLYVWLHDHLTPSLLDGSVQILNSMADGIDDAPLNQRIAALKYFTETLFKLTQMMPKGEERLVRVEFVDPSDGTTHPSPYWTRKDSGE